VRRVDRSRRAGRVDTAGVAHPHTDRTWRDLDLGEDRTIEARLATRGFQID
jgi:hypothetical protein